MEKKRTARVALPIIIVMLLPFLIDPQKSYNEYQHKTVLMGAFPKFTEWPQEVETEFADKSTPFVIGVIGKNPFIKKKKKEDWLSAGYRNQKIRDKKVEVRTDLTLDDIPGCHMLFISKSEKKKLKEIIAIAKENNVLTFADSPGFAKKGVHVNFYISGAKPKFELNQTTIRESGFIVSIRVLKIAKIVNPIKKK
ncbi:MAG: YfiR family protein [bacterium]|nr:YfiR family protein [bacterium]